MPAPPSLVALPPMPMMKFDWFGIERFDDEVSNAPCGGPAGVSGIEVDQCEARGPGHFDHGRLAVAESAPFGHDLFPEGTSHRGGLDTAA